MTAQVILVVEDNPITRKMIRYALETEGYDVVDAGSGQSALDAAGARRPDLLILDYVLPDSDGLALLADVRRLTQIPGLPAIVITGMVSRLDELREASDASTQFLAKPVEPSRLLEIVHAQLAAIGAPIGRRVLLVDDELLNRKLASFRLEQAGYEVETASGAAEALERARRRPPAAIVSDVMMPGMDGFTFCYEARRDPRLAAIPIVLVSSAYVEEPDRELAGRMGANALVVRTPDLGNVIAAFAEAMRAGAAPRAAPDEERLAVLHRERLQVQVERQTARNEALLRQAAIQATALSIIRGLSDVLAQPKDVTQIVGDVLVHCLDAAGLSTGLLYVVEPDGRHRLQTHFGLPAGSRADAEGGFGHPELLHKIVQSRVPVALAAVTAADAATSDFLKRFGHRSALVVPFVVLGQSFGELVLASDSQDLGESAWIAFARNISLQFGQTVALGESLKRLAESEERYRALMEQANEAIFVLNPDGLILGANQGAEGLLALSRQQVIGRHIADFAPSPGADMPESVRQFRQVTAAGGGRNDNMVLRRGDGGLVEVDFSVSVHEIGGTAYVLSIGRDVTERNRAAAALRDAQQRLHHVVTSSPAVLYSLRPEGQVFAANWVSENVERLLGYTAEEARAPDWWAAHLHPDERDRVFAELQRLFDEDYIAQEYRFCGRDGRYRWLRAELRLLRNAAGSAVEAVGSWADITARKEAELRLVESEEKYRLLFDSNPQPMWVYDQDSFAFLAVNDAALRHYGYSRDEWMALTAVDIRPPEDVAAFKQEYQEWMARRHHSSYHSPHAWRHRKKDGTVIEVDVSANEILFEGRKAWLQLVTDVTEKRSLEAQLVQSQKMESIGRLAGGIAHDFNNLLGVISGYGDLLRKRVAGDARLRKYAEDIVKAAERAAGLTRQLLAFSRKQVLQPKLLDLNSVVSEMEKMLRRLIGEDVHLVTVFDEALGTVRADPGQMEQVLMNLAVNARDAMPMGGRLTIETANADVDRAYTRLHPGMAPGSYVMLAVSDTGHGMAPEVQARIFEPFFTTKEAGKGTGLGLSTVHGIVKQSGGHIFVYSELGRGTTFKIYIPRVDESAHQAEPTEAEIALPRGSETVLLVEDEAALRELIRECLESLGYTVLEARYGAEALQICERHRGRIHLLITDVVMPGMSGRELGEQVRASRPEMRSLYMSGYTDDAVMLHGVLRADMAFLQKPFTEEALARKVREVIDAPV